MEPRRTIENLEIKDWRAGDQCQKYGRERRAKLNYFIKVAAYLRQLASKCSKEL
jgi:hypothetical protein